MSRSLSSAFLTAIAQERSERIFLFELEYSGGFIYLTDAPQDISYDGNTYQSAVGVLSWEDIQETEDRRGQGLSIQLSGVSTDIINRMLGEQFRGHAALIRVAAYDPDDGSVLATEKFFRGFQNNEYSLDEKVPDDPSQPASVTVSTKLGSRLVRMMDVKAVRMTTRGLQAYHRRIGIDTSTFEDKMFEFIPTLMDKQIRWGGEVVDEAS